MGERGLGHRTWAAAGVVLLALLWETFIITGWATTGTRVSAPTLAGSVTTGLLFVGCGLVAVRGTPFPRMGWILVLAGALWMLEDLYDVDAVVARAAFELTGGVSAFGFALAALAYPTGRLRSRIDVAVVVAAGLISFVLTPLATVTQYSGRECPGCGHQPLIIGGAHAVHDGAEVVGTVLGAAAVVVAVLVLARRWWVGTRPERRMTAPFLIAAVLVGLLNLEKVLVPTSSAVEGIRTFSFGLVPLAFLAGLTRMRLVRVGITGVVREMSRAPTLPRLRDALRTTLGDRRIAIQVRARDGWVDADGRPVAEPAAGPDLTTIPGRGGETVGALVHDPALAWDPELLDAVTGAVRLALETDALHREVGTQLARAADAADGERRRVARDLHDGAQQRLVGLMLDAAALRRRLGTGLDPESAALLAGIESGAQASLGDLRRLVHGLDPPTLAEEGLGPAVREASSTLPFAVSVEDRLDGRLPPPVETAAYLMVSEALANAAKHADGTGATVRLEQRDGTLAAWVSDDGRGGADPLSGGGLRGLQDRARALGGHVTVVSPPGGGTTVGIVLPVDVGAGDVPRPSGDADAVG